MKKITLILLSVLSLNLFSQVAPTPASNVATLNFTASAAAGAYANLTAISSSTATGASFSLSVPNGKYELIAVNAIITSSTSPTMEGWIFTSSVTTSGDKVALAGVLSDADMRKFVGDFRFDAAGVGNGTTFKYNGRIGSITTLNIPVIINVTGNALHLILVARGAWTPTASAPHKIIFYLKRIG